MEPTFILDLAIFYFRKQISPRICFDMCYWQDLYSLTWGQRIKEILSTVDI